MAGAGADSTAATCAIQFAPGSVCNEALSLTLLSFLSSSGARGGRDTRPLGALDQSVFLKRELLGELRPRGILMPSMAELERLAAPRRHRAMVGAGIKASETK